MGQHLRHADSVVGAHVSREQSRTGVVEPKLPLVQLMHASEIVLRLALLPMC